uniref:Uncharacterized protein n=1 Tax=Anguilla anguilla TaxID=7936 RepID=A0A0E9WJX2_ANGAN
MLSGICLLTACLGPVAGSGLGIWVLIWWHFPLMSGITLSKSGTSSNPSVFVPLSCNGAALL